MANFDTYSLHLRLKHQGFTEEQADALINEFRFFFGDEELRRNAIKNWRKLEYEVDSNYPLVPRHARKKQAP